MYDQVTQNKRRSALIIAGFVLVVAVVVGAFDLVLGGGGAIAFAIALPIAGIAAFLS